MWHRRQANQAVNPSPALRLDLSSVPPLVSGTHRSAGSVLGWSAGSVNFSLDRMTLDARAFLPVLGMETVEFPKPEGLPPPGSVRDTGGTFPLCFQMETLGQSVPIPVPSLPATPPPSPLPLDQQNPDLNGGGWHLPLCGAWDQGGARELSCHLPPGIWGRSTKMSADRQPRQLDACISFPVCLYAHCSPVTP